MTSHSYNKGLKINAEKCEMVSFSTATNFHYLEQHPLMARSNPPLQPSVLAVILYGTVTSLARKTVEDKITKARKVFLLLDALVDSRAHLTPSVVATCMRSVFHQFYRTTVWKWELDLRQQVAWGGFGTVSGPYGRKNLQDCQSIIPMPSAR